jgi:hypothetical protein
LKHSGSRSPRHPRPGETAGKDPQARDHIVIGDGDDLTTSPGQIAFGVGGSESLGRPTTCHWRDRSGQVAEARDVEPTSLSTPGSPSMVSPVASTAKRSVAETVPEAHGSEVIVSAEVRARCVLRLVAVASPVRKAFTSAPAEVTPLRTLTDA